MGQWPEPSYRALEVSDSPWNAAITAEINYECDALAVRGQGRIVSVRHLISPILSTTSMWITMSGASRHPTGRSTDALGVQKDLTAALVCAPPLFGNSINFRLNTCHSWQSIVTTCGRNVSKLLKRFMVCAGPPNLCA